MLKLLESLFFTLGQSLFFGDSQSDKPKKRP